MSAPYYSAYTGAQVDAGVKKASALWPLFTVDHLTGGDAGSLDGLDTTNLELGTVIWVVVNGVLMAYRLEETTALESEPDLITVDGRWHYEWVLLSSVVLSGLTASRVLVSDANRQVTSSDVSNTELGYLSGLSSSIQSQLDAKVAKVGDSMTGRLSLSMADPAVGSDRMVQLFSSDSLAANKGGSIGFGAVTKGGGAQNLLAYIAGRKTNATDGNTAGYLAFFTRSSGADPAERMRILDTGFIAVGISDPTSNTHEFQRDDELVLSATVCNNTASTAPSLKLKRSKGTWASRAVVNANDVLGYVTFSGAGGADVWSDSFKIQAVANGTFGSEYCSSDLVFLGATTNTIEEKWRMTGAGVWQAAGAQTIRTSTGNLTLATAGGNGNILLSPNGTGKVGIGGTPSFLLDINGQARASNLFRVQSALAFAADLTFDFDGDGEKTISLTDNITSMATANRGAGKRLVIILAADGSTRNTPVNQSWIAIGGAMPSTLGANKRRVIWLYCTGTDESNVLYSSLDQDAASGGGEANTGENVGSSGYGVYYGKSGTALQFRKLKAGSGVTIEEESGLQLLISSTGGGGAVPNSGSAYVVIGGSANSSTNGTALVNAYAAAKSATPHGSALALDNQFTIFLLPGIYTVSDGALVMDTSYINIVGLSTNTGRCSYHVSYTTDYGSTVIMSSGDTLTVTAYDTWIANVALVTSSTTKFAYKPSSGIRTGLRNVYIWNSSGQNNPSMPPNTSYCGYYEDVRAWNSRSFGYRTSGSVSVSGTFIRCKAAANAFGFALTPLNVTADGVFIDCEADGASFGQCGIASGTFIRCRYVTVSGASAGMFGRGGTASGIFIHCIGQGSQDFGETASGYFFECIAGSITGPGSGFGVYIATNKVASGVFYRCLAGNGSFGSGSANGGTASGTFYQCVAGNNSFGGGGTNGGTASGTFRQCVGGTNCFGSGGVPDSGTMSGVMEDCAMTGALRAAVSGRIERCRIVATGTDEDAVRVATGAKIYFCTLIGTGTGKSVNAPSSVTIPVGLCAMNLGLGSNVTNAITTPNNIVDTNVT